MSYRYPESSQLSCPRTAHVHLFDELPSVYLGRIVHLPLTAIGLPIVYQGKTWFPQNIGRAALQAAFKAINDDYGWTVETRHGRDSLVGEHDNGSFKIRLSLHVNRISPDLITAYPVSNLDRHVHPDFFQLDRFEEGYLTGFGTRPPDSDDRDYTKGYSYGLAAAEAEAEAG